MIKAIEFIVVLTLVIFSFFAGVKYSDSVRNHASWLFESKEDEVELPDLSNETTNEAGVTLEEGAANPEAVAKEAAPLDEINTNQNEQTKKAAPAVQ